MKSAAIIVALIVNSLLAFSQQQIWERIPDSAFVAPKFGRYFFRHHDCADALHAMVTVWDGSPSQRVAVLKTSDGGNHWDEPYADTASGPSQIIPLANVAYPDTNAVFVAGYYGYLILSADGGKTWSKKLVARREGQFGSAVGIVRMYDASNGAFIPDILADVIAITTDGWHSWDTISLRAIPLCSTSSVRLFVDEISCYGSGHVVATILEDTRKYVVQTTDIGLTWSYVNNIDFAEPLTTLQTGRFSFSDSTHGWYMYTSHTDSTNSFIHSVFRTNQSGSSWTRVYHGPLLDSVTDRMICLSARDSSNAIIGGSKFIYRTTDGGLTWRHDSVSNEQSGSLATAAVTQKPAMKGFANSLVGVYRTKEPAAELRIPNLESTNLFSAPNPASSLVVLTMPIDSIVTQVTLINILGETVTCNAEVDVGRISVDVSELPNGVYRVCVRYKSGRHDFLQVIVQR